MPGFLRQCVRLVSTCSDRGRLLRCHSVKGNVLEYDSLWYALNERDILKPTGRIDRSNCAQARGVTIAPHTGGTP